MEKKVCEGKGIVEEKSEHITKKQDKYWKFKIGGKTYSIFEFEAGKGISVGDEVQMYWTEKEGSYEGKPITYRNLNSISSIGDSRISKTDAELEQENKQVDKAIGGSGEPPKSTFGTIQQERERKIVKQTCIKAAAKFLSNKDSSISELITIAEKLESWVYKK